jgi:hypothetical protein
VPPVHIGHTVVLLVVEVLTGLLVVDELVVHALQDGS